MSEERELLKRFMTELKTEEDVVSLFNDIKECLALPEQDNIQYLLDQVARLTAENAMLKEKWSAPKQREPTAEPVAWITEWVQRYRHNDTPIIDRAVSFTKGDAPAVPNPNYIPLYTAPPKREPLGLEIMDVCGSEDYREGFKDGALYAEKHHGIGGGE